MDILLILIIILAFIIFLFLFILYLRIRIQIKYQNIEYKLNIKMKISIIGIKLFEKEYPEIEEETEDIKDSAEETESRKDTEEESKNPAEETESKKDTEESKEDKTKSFKEKWNEIKKFIPEIKSSIKLSLDFLINSIKDIKINKFDFHLKLGLYDYCKTAEIIGWFWTATTIPNNLSKSINLTAEPCFTEETLKFNGEIDIKINSLKILIKLLKLAIKKPVRTLIKEFIKIKRKDKSKKNKN